MKKLLLGFSLMASMLFASACTKPEIAIVLEDYCDFKVDTCNLQSAGTSHYENKSTCDRHHKDMLNSASSGNASRCSDEIEDFFIRIMNSQMAGGCDYTFMNTLTEEETMTIMNTMIKCFDDNDANMSETVPQVIDQIMDPGEERDAAFSLISLWLSSNK